MYVFIYNVEYEITIIHTVEENVNLLLTDYFCAFFVNAVGGFSLRENSSSLIG